MILAVALAPLTAGCAGDVQGHRATVVRDTVRNQLIVKNGPRGEWPGGEPWSLIETLRIGSVDGQPEELFGGTLHSVSVSEDGTIYVLDAQAEDVRVFDRDGRFIRSFGGPGPGPGELDNPGAMGLDRNGRVWVATLFNGRYSVFDSMGVLRETVSRSVRSGARFQHALVFDQVDSFVDEFGTNGLVGLIRVDTAGTVVDSFPSLRPPQRPAGLTSLPIRRGSAFREAVGYLPRLIWSVARDGSVWMTRSDTLKLVQRSLAGDTIQIIETSHRSSALASADLEVVRQGLAEVGRSELIDAFGRQFVHSIHVLGDGHVLVQVADDASQPNGRLLDVFTPDGVFLGTIEAGFAISRRAISAVRGDTLYTVAFGEHDVPFVIRAVVSRGASGR